DGCDIAQSSIRSDQNDIRNTFDRSPDPSSAIRRASALTSSSTRVAIAATVPSAAVSAWELPGSSGERRAAIYGTAAKVGARYARRQLPWPPGPSIERI